MDTWQYDQILTSQQKSTSHGTVVYEHGITITEITGYLHIGTSAGISIFQDNSKLVMEQDSTFIPTHRLIEIRFAGQPLELGS